MTTIYILLLVALVFITLSIWKRATDKDNNVQWKIWLRVAVIFIIISAYIYIVQG